MEAHMANSASKKDTPPPQKNKKTLEPVPDMFTRDSTCNGAPSKALPTDKIIMPEHSGNSRDSELVTQERNERATTRSSRKRKGRSESDCQASGLDLRIEETKKPPAKSPKANEVQSGGGMMTRRRKSLT